MKPPKLGPEEAYRALRAIADGKAVSLEIWELFRRAGYVEPEGTRWTGRAGPPMEGKLTESGKTLLAELDDALRALITKRKA